MREMYKEVIEGLMEGEAHLVMSSILCKFFFTNFTDTVAIAVHKTPTARS